MDRARQLAHLQALAEARRDADVAALAQLRQELRAVEMQIARLEEAAAEQRSDDAAAPSAFQMSGRDALWDVWRLGRVRELAQKSARIRAEIERQSVQARRAVGKHQVIGKLIERMAVPPSKT